MEWITEADGVFRGGGVKGIALAGALAGFAEHPEKPVTRWVSVAGASAGAIIACYLACGHSAQEMVTLLTRTPFASFEDTPGGKVGGALNLVRRHGFARGAAFERWFDGELGGATFAATRADDDADGRPAWHLKLVAVDVTQRRLLVLPQDLAGYAETKGGPPIVPDAFPIARAARMSMSIPYFFEPITLYDAAGRACTIVDGGTLSNFPVWLFDVEGGPGAAAPKRPTFGFTLHGGRGFAPGSPLLSRLVPWPLHLASDIFHTAQDGWDARFASHSTRVRTLSVDAGDVGTTEFALSTAKQEMLLTNGRTAARSFLDGFSLEDYINGYGRRLAGAAAPA